MGPLQGPKSGLLSYHSEKNCPRRHVLTKQEILLGNGARVESGR